MKKYRIKDFYKEKFLSRIKKDSNKCWIWTGYFGGSGKFQYGRLSFNKKYVAAHRFSFEYHKEKIPKGMLVCHTCDNPKCVNPEHLFIGTYKDNNIDSVDKNRHAQKRKTHCPKGHEYSKENTYIINLKNGRHGRMCLTCRIDHRAKYNLTHNSLVCGTKGIKLNYDKATKIRHEFNAGVTRVDLAKKYNVSYQRIAHVVTNKVWKTK